MSAERPNKDVVLTGMRPTGQLHLGHYVGALEQWLEVAKNPAYDCYFLIADYHALGDNFDDVPKIIDSVQQVVIDWMSVGLDPEKSSFVVQSYVPEHAELTMFLSQMTPNSWLTRNPTLRHEIETLGKDVTVGFATYPMSQVADILLPRATLVPVGEDQRPHIEFTREVARRFNNLYDEVFPEPQEQIGRIPRLVGTDGGEKMGKSTNNAIFLADSEEEVERKVMGMYTDPNKQRISDHGNTEGHPVFIYHDVFNPDKEEVEDLKQRYENGQAGDVEVKRKLVTVLNEFLGPIRERRARLEQEPSLVSEAIEAGSGREKVIAEETLDLVKTAMKTKY